jgi:hypothetical protein
MDNDQYEITSIDGHEDKSDGYYFHVVWQGGESSWVHESYIDPGPLISNYIQANQLPEQDLQAVIGLMYSFDFFYLNLKFFN